MDNQRYAYSLHVEQQPQRARMCGFGDKDRRPITPPPCVRLQIIDRSTGQEVDVSQLDISFYVLTVGLWDENAQNELNLVVHPSSTQNTNNISIGQPTSGYRANTDHSRPEPHNSSGESSGQYQTASGVSGFAHATHNNDPTPGSQLPSSGGTEAYKGLDRDSGNSTSHLPPIHDYLNRNAGSLSDKSLPATSQQNMSQHIPGSFTRNLIGSLVASAFKLKDTNERLGIWFVLQDLSVRTEGSFRLKFCFANLGTGQQALLTSGSAPVLCSAFSNPFNVFSAKRMIESTDISRKFSNQGIKIPVRKSDS